MPQFASGSATALASANFCAIVCDIDFPEIRRLRRAMGLTQTGFGQLPEAHSVTVSRQEIDGWSEVPGDCQMALMQGFQPAADTQAFDRAAEDPPVVAGIAATIFFFLIAARVS